MKKIFASLFIILSVAGGAQLVLADEGVPSGTTSPMLGKLKTVGKGAGYSTGADQGSVLDLVGSLINVALGLLGLVFIILIIVAGLNWMTAAGEEEKIKKAGSTIRAAVIGLLIVISAFAIWTFISTQLIAGGSPT